MPLRGPLLTGLAFVVYAVVHSLLASLEAKRRARDSFGPLADRVYRFAYNLFSGVTLIPVLAIPVLYPGEQLYSLSGGLLIASTTVQLTGAAIILVGMLQTGIMHFLGLRQLFGTPSTVDAPMITHGLYRYMRHPLYTGGLLFIWFLPRMTTSLLVFNLVATLYLYVGSIFEERRLIDEFGDAYRTYQQQVPRLLPRLWKQRTS